MIFIYNSIGNLKMNLIKKMRKQLAAISNLVNNYQFLTPRERNNISLYDILKDMEIIREIKIDDEVIGFSEDLGNIAILKKKESIGMENWLKYDRKVHQLKKQGYTVIHASDEKPDELPHRRVYDILE